MTGRRVALTFDAEPGDRPRHSLGAKGWRRVLDVLDREAVPSTFFVLGSFALAEPKLTRRTADAGHLLGNHSMTHPSFRDDVGRVGAELAEAETAIASVCGRSTAPWCRIPYLDGDDDPAVLAAIEASGYEHVRENCDAKDWYDALVPTSRQVADRVRQEAGDLDPLVVLMYTWPKTTPKALRSVIAWCKAEDATFVTVDQLTSAERRELPTTRVS